MLNTFAKLQTFINEGLLDGNAIGETFLLSLMNIARVAMEEERPWKVLQTEDSSQTISGGDIYTSMKDLPDDFASAGKVLFVGNSDGSSITQYTQIPYSSRRKYKDVGNRFYIDLVNSQFALTGTGQAGKTIFLPYKKVGQEITTSLLWSFPTRFNALIGFMVVEMNKGGVDYDSITARQLIQHRKDAMMLLSAMIEWDAGLQYNAIGGSYEGTNEAYDSDGLPVRAEVETPLGSM